MEITLPYRWQPRPYQRRAWDYLAAGGKRAVLCYHRRAGKDEIALHATACALHERIGNYAHMLPEYSQARKAIWSAVNPTSGKKRIDEAFPDLLRKATRDQEMMIEFKNGSTWQVVGSDAYNSLMGTSYAGIVLSEYALANPSAWGYFSPILRENNGWALFISTPRGHNHFEAMLKTAQREPDWFAEVLPNTLTHVFSTDALDEELRQLQDLHGDDYGKSLWMQEYECSFDAAIPGSIWGDCVERAQREGRIGSVPTLAGFPVDTAFDMGYSDDTAIWFRQLVSRAIHVIDHHSSNGKDVQFYVELLLAKRQACGWTYGTHYLPHDARPRTLAAGGKSILQQFYDAAKAHPELGRFAILPRLDVQEGIMAARKTFPYCRFDQTRCAKGLASLRQYHREWDDEKKMFLVSPTHDFSSHDADAWRYLSLSWKMTDPAHPETPFEQKLRDGNPIHQPWKDHVAAHFAKHRAAREARMA